MCAARYRNFDRQFSNRERVILPFEWKVVSSRAADIFFCDERSYRRAADNKHFASDLSTRADTQNFFGRKKFWTKAARYRNFDKQFISQGNHTFAVWMDYFCQIEPEFSFFRLGRATLQTINISQAISQHVQSRKFLPCCFKICYFQINRGSM